MWQIILLLILNALFIIIFVKRYRSIYGVQEKKLKDILNSQDRSAKMLIRRDIELTRANEKLLGLDTQKSEFISIIAHQMRTPLSAIKWTLGMLIKNELGPLTIDQTNFLSKASETNEHMIGLVEDMLLADRLESGRTEIKKAEVNISDLIDEVLHELTQKIKIKNIQIHKSGCDKTVCTIMADKEKIRAVLQNLLENSVKYTQQDGSVIIQEYEKDGLLFISIKDSGIGIPKDQQPYIFTKFYRARNASRVDANGSGLGLFIAKSIVERHGGTISCSSEEGKGSLFIFSLKRD